jgi:hypothetical protein
MCHRWGRKKKAGITRKGMRNGERENGNERKTIICRFVRRTALVPTFFISDKIICRKMLVSDNWCRALYASGNSYCHSVPGWQL